MFTVRPYAQADSSAWDALVERSRNGNLLHRRGYMDYHADRFVDRSLMIERHGEVAAVFPANIHDRTATSHGGLTYAGLITSDALRAESTLAVFGQIGDHYRALGVERLIYKAVPHVFHAYPAEEDLYALHRLGAQLKRRDLSSVIPLQEAFHFTPGRRHAIDKAKKAGIRVQADAGLEDFHALLSDVLRRHNAVPTHSLAELRLLQARFPRHIVLHEARIGDLLLAGVLIYDFGRIVHTQYMAVSEQGRRLDALSFLLAELIEHTYAARLHFSFGISTEQEGRVLNGGLIAQKEYFGARAVVHDVYEWRL
ncbi:GNAT family N-acetyltransferase [Rhodanobacter glycinis]|uniref:GNAT family N-acetyltransferase n=1 Tax=Rhodanobacter glycinis TaxID=582702 RepID=A0A502FBU5_9GAMM|nr:GNAT family N-acetyltransferase [Rhodanobacter glycinis]TPG11387.1 GNAT family N-acetyltransferase [Rhodanobacter glycinis]TPG46804.1 GNAT family N-acetyltransferase [Rhodanobacter glycinis]